MGTEDKLKTDRLLNPETFPPTLFPLHKSKPAFVQQQYCSNVYEFRAVIELSLR